MGWDIKRACALPLGIGLERGCPSPENCFFWGLEMRIMVQCAFSGPFEYCVSAL